MRLAVGDVDVVDGERVTIDGFDDGLKGRVVAHSFGGELAKFERGYWDRLVRSLRPDSTALRTANGDLVGDHAVLVVGLLTKNGGAAEVDQGKDPEMRARAVMASTSLVLR